MRAAVFAGVPDSYIDSGAATFTRMPSGMALARFAEGAATAFETAGVLVMLGGALVTLGLVLASRDRQNLQDMLLDFRRRFGRAMVLGLELLVAADILHTLATPGLREVIALASIVVIRTFLSWSLVVEIEGRWPWQPRPPPVVAAPGRTHTTPVTT